jgi:uncharacterized protein
MTRLPERAGTAAQICREAVALAPTHTVRQHRLVLEMRMECERCRTALQPDGEARICSYECTFCSTCADELSAACPNCGGELVRRPRRVT